MQDYQFYKTLKTDDAFELREYDELILAKVVVNGPFENAYKNGGNLLDQYLLGANESREKISIQSPYILTSLPDGWEVSCILPPYLRGEYVPTPLDHTIKFVEIEPRQVAVVGFHGKSAYSAMMRRMDELKSWAKKTHLNVNRHSSIAVYKNGFFPFMRKNEIQSDIIQ